VRSPQDSPHRGGTWRRSDFLAYERRQRAKFLLIGFICVAVGLAALAVFVWRGGF
jgi:hypothetical protein